MNGYEIVIDPKLKAIRQYWDALKTVVSDLKITDNELQYVIAERKRLGLAKEQVRVLHLQPIRLCGLPVKVRSW